MKDESQVGTILNKPTVRRKGGQMEDGREEFRHLYIKLP